MNSYKASPKERHGKAPSSNIPFVREIVLDTVMDSREYIVLTGHKLCKTLM